MTDEVRAAQEALTLEAARQATAVAEDMRSPWGSIFDSALKHSDAIGNGRSFVFAFITIAGMLAWERQREAVLFAYFALLLFKTMQIKKWRLKTSTDFLRSYQYALTWSTEYGRLRIKAADALFEHVVAPKPLVAVFVAPEAPGEAASVSVGSKDENH